jgi:glycosyltransferase involved in cell wall biosynthesis
MVRELRRNGIDVSVLTAMPNYPSGRLAPGYEGRWWMRDSVDDVEVRRTWIYAATGRSARVRLANYLSFTATAMPPALFRRRPDVLFVESQPLSLGVIALALKWLRGVPYIYNVPDLQVDVARQLGFMGNRRVLALAKSMEDRFLRESWKVSTVTHRFIEHFQSRGLPREQITFLPNGADTDFLRPQPASDKMLDRWNLRGKKTFMYVGTHAFYHGLDTLIEAAALLRDHDELRFLLIGDGPERERLKAMAAERGLNNVVFGASPYEEMAELYSIAYASVATLRDMPVAEAMRLSKVFPSLSCGVPVVYAGRGEAAELLASNDAGLALPPEKPDVLAKAMLDLANDQQARDRMGTSGHDLVERSYSWAGIVSRWLAELGPLPSSR